MVLSLLKAVFFTSLTLCLSPDSCLLWMRREEELEQPALTSLLPWCQLWVFLWQCLSWLLWTIVKEAISKYTALEVLHIVGLASYLHGLRWMGIQVGMLPRCTVLHWSLGCLMEQRANVRNATGRIRDERWTKEDINMLQVTLLFLCPSHTHLPESKIPAIVSNSAKMQY